MLVGDFLPIAKSHFSFAFDNEQDHIGVVVCSFAKLSLGGMLITTNSLKAPLQTVWRKARFFFAASLMLSWKDRTVDSVCRALCAMVHLLDSNSGSHFVVRGWCVLILLEFHPAVHHRLGGGFI